MPPKGTDTSVIFSEILISSPPQEILAQFIDELEVSLNSLYRWVIKLQEYSEQGQKLEAFAQTRNFSAAIGNQIDSIIDYLDTYQKSHNQEGMTEFSNSFFFDPETFIDLISFSHSPFSSEQILSMFTHELRHPISAIKNYSDLYLLDYAKYQSELEETERMFSETTPPMKQMHILISNYYEVWLKSEKRNSATTDIRTSSKPILLADQVLERFLAILPNFQRGWVTELQRPIGQDERQKALERISEFVDYMEKLRTSANNYLDRESKPERRYESMDKPSISAKGILVQFSSELKYLLISLKNRAVLILDTDNPDKQEKVIKEIINVVEAIDSLWNSTNNNFRIWLNSNEDELTGDD